MRNDAILNNNHAKKKKNRTLEKKHILKATTIIL